MQLWSHLMDMIKEFLSLFSRHNAYFIFMNLTGIYFSSCFTSFF